jgi:hypothetical protein
MPCKPKAFTAPPLPCRPMVAILKGLERCKFLIEEFIILFSLIYPYLSLAGTASRYLLWVCLPCSRVRDRSQREGSARDSGVQAEGRCMLPLRDCKEAEQV